MQALVKFIVYGGKRVIRSYLFQKEFHQKFTTVPATRAAGESK